MTATKEQMNTLSAVRRDLINFRTANARQPALSHRASTAGSQLEHLESPADADHARRLRKAIGLTMSEIERIKRNNACYKPIHRRLRPYRKSR
jgi:hypothetical protein